MRRIQILVGLAFVGIASYLGTDPGQRIKTALDALAVLWPWLLLVLAAAAALATLVEFRRLVGPLSLAVIAGTVLYVQTDQILFNYLPFLAIAVGATVALTAVRPSSHRLVSVIWPGRWVFRDQLLNGLRVTCVFAAMTVDLRDTALTEDLVFSVTTVVGHVRLQIPAQWPVVVDDAPPTSVALDERGRRDSVDTALASLRLRSAGVLGSVVVERY